MPRIALYVHEETRRRMAQHPKINWSLLFRAAVEAKLDLLEEKDNAKHPSPSQNNYSLRRPQLP